MAMTSLSPGMHVVPSNRADHERERTLRNGVLPAEGNHQLASFSGARNPLQGLDK